jgi:hypothetical protein
MALRAVLIVILGLAGLSACASSMELKEFASDGCSLFPDGNFKDRDLWCGCCLEHDVAYWRGGSEEERLRADTELRECMQAKTGDAVLAQSMFAGVRAGGAPVFPTWYRWGYGWNYGRNYQPLSDAERRLAEAKLAAYRANGSARVCVK